VTCQAPERIEYEGEELMLYTEPLQAILPPTPKFGMNIGDSNDPYPFEVSSTALWRGYIGRWKIQDGRLCLVELQGRLVKGGDASISSIFPGHHGYVFADWFSGELMCPRGKVIGHVDGMYLNVFEEDLILKVKSGIIIGKTIRKNEVPVETDSDMDFE